MNLKILAFPLLILAIIVFSIWFVYPAYSELALTRAKLDEVGKNIENIDQKIQIAERLNEEITNNGRHEKVLMDLIPFEKNEEEIVNELNDLAFTQGMVVYGLSFESGKVSLEDVPVPALDELGNPLYDPATGQPIYSESIPKIKSSQSIIKAVGDYDKIKGFLRKMGKLKRTNSIASIKISKEASVVSGENLENSDSGVLNMEVAINFMYLEKVKNTIDINDGIFTSGQLNLSALDEIQKIKDTVIPELRADSQGKSNPFVL